MENIKKIEVPDIITREWLNDVFEPLEKVDDPDIFAKAKRRMGLVRAGVFSVMEMRRIQSVRENFRAEDDRREEIENGHKKTAEKIAFLEEAMKKAIPALIETAKKWNGKVFDKRFLDALNETKNTWAHKLTYGDGVEITYSAGYARELTLANFYHLDDILTEEDGKRPRINADPIIKALEIEQEHIANYIGRVKQTENEIESIRELIHKAITYRNAVQRYDRETLTAYGLDNYGLKTLGI